MPFDWPGISEILFDLMAWFWNLKFPGGVFEIFHFGLFRPKVKIIFSANDIAILPLYTTWLTLKWSRPSALPLVVKGVPMDPNSEKYFPEWICRWNAGHW